MIMVALKPQCYLNRNCLLAQSTDRSKKSTAIAQADHFPYRVYAIALKHPPKAFQGGLQAKH